MNPGTLTWANYCQSFYFLSNIAGRKNKDYVNFEFELELDNKIYRAEGKIASLQLKKLWNIPNKSEDWDRDNEEDAFIEQPADKTLWYDR